MYRRCIVIALAASALAGCASSSIDAQTKAAISSVYIEPAQLSKVSVFAPTASELVASGRVPLTVAEASTKLQGLVDTRVQLARLVEEQAKRELLQKGYRLSADSASAGARLKLIVNHGLSVATGPNDGRGIAMAVGAELFRVSDGKRLVFGGATQVQDPARRGIRLAPYAEWLSNDELLVEQYRLVSQALIAHALEGL